MRAILVPTVATLAAVVLLLAASLTAVRVAIRRQHRRERRFGPGASQSVALYVAGVRAAPRPTGRFERAIFRDVALAALANLRGSERDDLVALMGQLGYLYDAMAALMSRHRAARRQAAEMLALVGTGSTAPGLAVGLGDPDPLVRTSCARTLAQTGTEDVLSGVAATVEHDIQEVPGAAAAVVLALGRNRPASLVQLLRADARAPVRAIAVQVAGRLRLAELAPSLRACLHDGDDLAAVAAEGLGLIGDIESVGALRDMARDHHRARPARIAAARALGSIGDPGSVPLLESLLRADDWSMRAAAAQALGWLGERGEAALHRAAGSGRADVREQAEAALQP
jgi:HEAT repeat protein